MDRLLGKFLHVIFTCVTFPMTLAGLWVAATLARARPVRVGKLTICGPPSFLELCRGSLERLASLDPMMYRRLTGDQRVWVFYEDTRSEQFGPPWVVAINSAYVKWQNEGIIARLVYLIYCMAAFPRPVMSRKEQAAAGPRRLAALAQTKAWLEERAFPGALIGCFSEQSASQGGLTKGSSQ
jgi:hypothetical protein